MILHLIRHGQTLANQQRLYCGKTDLPLTESGKNGIKLLASLGIYPPLEGLAVYTSGLLRVRQTLEAIYGKVPCLELSAFREMDFGAFEMKSYEQLKENPAYIAWIEDQTGSVACPGGESQAIFARRVITGFQEVVDKGMPALVVCHGGVITCLMQHLFPKEPRHFYQWQPRPGEGYTVHLPKEGTCYFSDLSKPQQGLLFSER
jgi:alpha-ribazole phosphatase